MSNRFIRCFALIAVLCSLAIGGAKADVMDVDVSGVDPAFQSHFLQAEAFWESRIKGYSSKLPDIVKRQLTKLQITASTVNIDGVGGVLGQAGPVNVLRFGGNSLNGRAPKPIAIAQTSQMQFDNDDMADMLATGDLVEVIKHEMAHALGFGSLWADNALLTTTGFGVPNYIGAYGVKQYRIDSGKRFAFYVPVEQQGGGGTAGSHWEDNDPFFNQRGRNGTSDLMIGSIDLGNEQKFTSETTWASFADLWYAVDGFNGGDLYNVGTGRKIWPKWGGGTRIFLTNVPEPGTLSVLGLMGLVGLGFRRKRK